MQNLQPAHEGCATVLPHESAQVNSLHQSEHMASTVCTPLLHSSSRRKSVAADSSRPRRMAQMRRDIQQGFLG